MKLGEWAGLASSTPTAPRARLSSAPASSSPTTARSRGSHHPPELPQQRRQLSECSSRRRSPSAARRRFIEKIVGVAPRLIVRRAGPARTNIPTATRLRIRAPAGADSPSPVRSPRRPLPLLQLDQRVVIFFSLSPDFARTRSTRAAAAAGEARPFLAFRLFLTIVHLHDPRPVLRLDELGARARAPPACPPRTCARVLDTCRVRGVARVQQGLCARPRGVARRPARLVAPPRASSRRAPLISLVSSSSSSPSRRRFILRFILRVVFVVFVVVAAGLGPWSVSVHQRLDRLRSPWRTGSYRPCARR